MAEVIIAPYGEELSIYYYTKGDPKLPALVFVHGLTSNSKTWESITDELSRIFYCIALDLPGHGFSSVMEKEAYSVVFFSRAVLTVTHHLKLNSFHLVGHSMGGLIAARLSANNPGKVKTLTLVAPAMIEVFSEPEKKWLTSAPAIQSILSRLQYKEFRDTYASVGFNAFESAESLWKIAADNEKLLRECITSMLEEDAHSDFRRIQAPTLLCFGAGDKLIPNPYLNHPSTAHILEAGLHLIPKCKGLLFRRSGHYVHQDQGEKFRSELELFLKTDLGFSTGVRIIP